MEGRINKPEQGAETPFDLERDSSPESGTDSSPESGTDSSSESESDSSSESEGHTKQGKLEFVAEATTSTLGNSKQNALFNLSAKFDNYYDKVTKKFLRSLKDFDGQDSEQFKFYSNLLEIIKNELKTVFQKDKKNEFKENLRLWTTIEFQIESRLSLQSVKLPQTATNEFKPIPILSLTNDLQALLFFLKKLWGYALYIAYLQDPLLMPTSETLDLISTWINKKFPEYCDELKILSTYQQIENNIQNQFKDILKKDIKEHIAQEVEKQTKAEQDACFNKELDDLYSKATSNLKTFLVAQKNKFFCGQKTIKENADKITNMIENQEKNATAQKKIYSLNSFLIDNKIIPTWIFKTTSVYTNTFKEITNLALLSDNYKTYKKKANKIIQKYKCNDHGLMFIEQELKNLKVDETKELKENLNLIKNFKENLITQFNRNDLSTTKNFSDIDSHIRSFGYIRSLRGHKKLKEEHHINNPYKNLLYDLIKELNILIDESKINPETFVESRKRNEQK